MFDVESPRPHPRLDAALALADRNGVRCAISNPCFELWLLLHFGDQTAYLTTADACRRLDDCPCGYSPRSKGLNYEAVRVHQRDAIDRATRLDARHSDATVSRRNPWTSVHILMRDLLKQA